MRLLSVVYPGHRPRCSATAIAASWGKDLCAPRYISASGAMESSERSRDSAGRLLRRIITEEYYFPARASRNTR